MVAQRISPVWRLSLLWQETLLDAVTLDPRRARARLRLRTGEQLLVIALADGVEIRGEALWARVLPGQRVVLPAGHELQVDLDERAPQARGELSVDSTLLHAAMIGVSITICIVSALWFAPVAAPLEPGAGIPAEARRWLSLPGGMARTVGRATFSAPGRRPQEAERVTAERTRGAPLPRSTTPAASLERTLEAMKQALHGANGDGLRDPLGEITRALAQAPVLGAGVGGLAPRDPADAGPGTGLIAAGDTARIQRLLRETLVRNEQKIAQKLPPPQKPTDPVSLMEVPRAEVDNDRVDAESALDPLVRDHLVRAVRTRHNVIRGCYEAWGLSADPHRTGRLVLSLTLLPDGHVADVDTHASAGLSLVGDCVVRAAREWYLGGGLVDTPTRLAFPFILQPRT